MLQCLLGDLLPSEGRKLHLQILLRASICECAETCSLVTPAQKDDYRTFFQSPFPMLPMLALHACFFVLYPINTSALCLWGGRYEIYSPVSSLGCLVNKHSLPQTSETQRFSLLHVRQNETDSVTLLLPTLF